MRIGITGATGFIGTALSRAAQARGHHIIAYSRRAVGPVPGAFAMRHYDADHPERLDVSGLDALVHLAGESVLGRWTVSKKERIRASRVQSTAGIVAALKDCARRPPVFVCGSASGAYGDRGDELLTESSARGSGFLAEVCTEWEAAAARASALGVSVSLLRTGVVLGRDGGAWPLLRRVFKLCLGSRLGTGRQWMPWIHIDDEVALILEVIERGLSGPINLAAPNPVTNAEFTRQVASALKTMTAPPVPAFLLKLVFGESATMLLGGQRMQPKAALDAALAFRHPEIAGALAACV